MKNTRREFIVKSAMGTVILVGGLSSYQSGYLCMMHFVSAIPNAGPYHEFKGFNKDIPLECKTSSLESEEGVVAVPSGPGMGLDIDPDYISKHTLVEA